jgi:hypothetical protein
MKHEPEEFSRQHPALDRALRDQVKAPKVDGAFRQQVFARVAAQRAELARMAASPGAGLARLRAQFVLQVLNLGAIALVAGLLLRAAWPTLEPIAARMSQELPAVDSIPYSGLALSMTAAAAALAYGLYRARLLGWVRGLGL